MPLMELWKQECNRLLAAAKAVVEVAHQVRAKTPQLEPIELANAIWEALPDKADIRLVDGEVAGYQHHWFEVLLDMDRLQELYGEAGRREILSCIPLPHRYIIEPMAHGVEPSVLLIGPDSHFRLLYRWKIAR